MATEGRVIGDPEEEHKLMKNDELKEYQEYYWRSETETESYAYKIEAGGK